MGQEIEQRFFPGHDFNTFRERLEGETELLRQSCNRQEFSSRGEVAGFELEVWLIDANGDPLPCNDAYLQILNNPLVVPELASYNIEINGSPSALSGHVFSRLRDELSSTWHACEQAAAKMRCELVTIGILPTVRKEMLSSEFMSSMVRYQSLNDRVMSMRDGRALDVDIDGEDHLHTTHTDVMLEAGATSFQIHLQCRPERAVRDFNASMAISAPMVAVSANSPYLFGQCLWEETRIPLFEQSLALGDRFKPRVSFGDGYATNSLVEIFEQNQKDFVILLPYLSDMPADRFDHVRFHNGTLWRWNRPLIGFDFDGRAHLRIEHRVVPAGPTIKDSIANTALFFGLIYGLGLRSKPIEEYMPFEQVRENFYNAARYGLQARVLWTDEDGEKEIGMRQLMIEKLMPIARDGLQSLDLPQDEIDTHLGIIDARLDNAQNGAAWQRRWVGRHGKDMNDLVRAYKEQQDSGEPVHSWPL